MKKMACMMSFLLAMTFIGTGCSTDEDPPVEKFTVTFDSKGGSAVNSMEIEKGAKITKPTNPVNGTLLFVDWFKEAACTNVWNFNSDVVTADITLYAKWATVEYTVTFNTNGGSAIEPVKVAEGSTLLAPLPPSKNGAAFENWYKEAALTTIYDFSSPVTGNLTLYAKWTTVTRETLQTLVSEAYGIDQRNYTAASYQAMGLKRDAARGVLENMGATSAQIITAYTELQAAISALVALPVKEAVAIEISSSIIDGFLYVTPGEYTNLGAYAADAQGEYATDSRVAFTYNESQLADWANSDIQLGDNSLSFYAKSTLAAGQTISIIIKSASKPAVSTTVMLKVAAPGTLKTQFLEAVNALPVPSQISYEHIELIGRAWSLYWALTQDDRGEAAVQAAYDKLRACDDKVDELPKRFDYSFSGNVCTFNFVDYREDKPITLNFVANGAFPQGTYTMTEWGHYEFETYTQTRLIFKSGGNGVVEERTSQSANGSNPTAWKEAGTFTYTFTGTQASGGRFIITF